MNYNWNWGILFQQSLDGSGSYLEMLLRPGSNASHRSRCMASCAVTGSCRRGDADDAVSPGLPKGLRAHMWNCFANTFLTAFPLVFRVA